MNDIEGMINAIKFLYLNSLLAAIVTLGAVCNGLAQYSAARKNDTKFDKIDIGIAIVISIFSGIIFGLIAAHFWPGQQLVLHGVSGMGAFLGLNGLNKLTDIFLEVVSRHARRTNDKS